KDAGADLKYRPEDVPCAVRPPCRISLELVLDVSRAGDGQSDDRQEDERAAEHQPEAELPRNLEGFALHDPEKARAPRRNAHELPPVRLRKMSSRSFCRSLT